MECASAISSLKLQGCEEISLTGTAKRPVLDKICTFNESGKS